MSGVNIVAPWAGKNFENTPTHNKSVWTMSENY